MKTRWKWILMLLVFILGALALGVWIFLKSSQFGALPEGRRLERMQQSPQYADGIFHNTLPTPLMTDGKSTITALLQSFFMKKDNTIPPSPVPTVKTALKSLDRNTDTVIWLGHSSFFIQLGGQRILIDPVLSDHAAPVSFSTRAFLGSNPYTVEDLPNIDVLLISHDHWDHLDYPTLTALRPKIGQIICGLGVGAHLQRWGFSPSSIYEGDWGERVTLGSLSIYLTPARHFSGRSLTRNKSLWLGFVLETAQRRLFYSGDSGYSPHFAELGKQFGTFDLVLLECGQYDKAWNLIHMMPEETAKAADDLHAKRLLPAHSGKFSIAYHAWDEPYKRLTAASLGKKWQLATPMIGEPLVFDTAQAMNAKTAPEWWEHMRSQ
ncbi:MAG: MBL fold metallo-hydrolase [Desulfovibrionaceae bacterium]|nr:MBL fold metallo-hydrolase [Desulfovibrionaceae bacterium]